jgi:hypothetical protein
MREGKKKHKKDFATKPNEEFICRSTSWFMISLLLILDELDSG